NDRTRNRSASRSATSERHISASSSTTNTVELFGASGMLRCDGRQRKADCRAARQRAVRPDLPAMRLDDRSAHRQANPQSFGFGRREKRKQKVGVKVEAGAPIGHSERDVALAGGRLNVDSLCVAGASAQCLK